MSAYSAIDLSQVPAPDVVETLSYETILSDMKSVLTESLGNDAWDMESEPMTKLLEVCAYRELLLRQRVNDAARQTMLAYATGSNLDNLAALLGVVRQEAETDSRLRTRTQLALEGFSTAGPAGSYVYHALAADSRVKDVSVSSPEPGQVVVTILSTEVDGVASAELLDTVSTYLNHEDVRPLTDLVTVQPANIVPYSIDATLVFYPGPDTGPIHQAAVAAAEEYREQHHALGHDITLSGLYAALHQPGVQNVQLTSPSEDLILSDVQAAHCTNVTINIGGRNE